MTESQETIALANWLRANNYLFTKSPNETYTTSRNQKRKNTLEGVSSGFPDMTIVLKRGSLLFLEMKKTRGPRGGDNGSDYSDPDQIKWLKSLDSLDNVKACYASGYEDAIRIIEKTENI